MAKSLFRSSSKLQRPPSAAPPPEPFEPLNELSQVILAARAAFSGKMSDFDGLISEYTHMRGMSDEKYALTTLRKIASCVKPIMRKRGWRVGTLSEFYPDQHNLIGLNVNHGQQIMLRLRYAHNSRSFMPFEDCLDTMLHELCHIEIGPHNAQFHKLWNELRDEWFALQLKGYTGEGFLGNGRMLGGQRIPNEELRRRARAAAQQRQRENHGKVPGRKLGGAIPKPRNVRDAVAEATLRRTKALDSTEGCGTGTKAGARAAEDALLNGFTTKEDMDEADQVAINEALFELMSMEEEQKLRDSQDPSYPTEGLVWTAENGLQAAPTPVASSSNPQMPKLRASSSIPAKKQPDRSGRANRPVSRLVSEADQRPGKISKSSSTSVSKGIQAKGPEPASWQCKTCTLINEANASRCDACDSEGPARPLAAQTKASVRPPQPKENRVPMGWNCRQCGTFMESQWWTCSLCSLMKANS